MLAIDSRLRSALVAYSVFTTATLSLAFPHGATLSALAFFFALAVVKLALGPFALVMLVKLGLLMLGSAITLSGAVFAPGLPSAIEIADTFDAVVATVVALAIARALIGFDPQLDIRSLRELRG
jgi:hydrogenase-4 membrane subunit HyfE